MSEGVADGRRETRVHRVCAWCSVVLETTRAPWAGQEDLATHGMCRSCAWEARLRSQPIPGVFESGARRVATAS